MPKAVITQSVVHRRKNTREKKKNFCCSPKSQFKIKYCEKKRIFTHRLF